MMRGSNKPEPLAGIQRVLADLDQAHLYRRRRTVEVHSAQGAEAVVDGKRCVNFCSNDYLGLSKHPDLVNAFKKSADTYGVGSGAAHLVTGHTREHHALEEELADFLQYPRALLFSTGYMANLGVSGALLGRGDLALQDKLNHASLLDAAKLSGARLLRYRHADAAALAERLDAAEDSRMLVSTDGVFSMDGDLAPLPEIAGLTTKYGAWLMVDDAHGFGVLGDKGRGSPEHLGILPRQIPIHMVTLGKALGTFGAAVAGEDALVEFLIQRARTYIYTTAPPAPVAAAARAALRLVREQAWGRDRLRERIRQFKDGAAQLQLTLMPSHTAIQPLVVGNSAKAVEASQALWDRGLWVSAIRPPTVPQGSARLRITLCANHSEGQVERLLSALHETLHRL